MPGYALYCNLETEMRGTAFLVREGISLYHVDKLTSGRAIAAVFQGILLVNLYPPSGTSMKAEREAFYNLDLLSLLRNEVSQVILGGDFNCVINPCDVTGQYTRCKALEAIVHGYVLTDSWTQNVLSPVFTYHYASRSIEARSTISLGRIGGPEIQLLVVPAAYTDHCAVELRMKTPEYSTTNTQTFLDTATGNTEKSGDAADQSCVCALERGEEDSTRM
jgi:hypothetical protein